MFRSGDIVMKGVSKSWTSIIIIVMLLFSYIVIAVPSTVRADDGPPGAPTLSAATPGNGQVTLTWMAGSIGGSPILHYSVQGGPSTIDNIAGLTTTVTGLTNGQSYTFTVRAVTAAGTSGDSNSVSSTPYTTPNAPTGLRAVAGNGQVLLNWTAPANNGGNAIDYYTIIQSSAVLSTHYTGNSATITGLTNGQSYAFSVAAHNPAGNGAQTGEVIVTPFTVPSAPVLTGVPGLNNVSLSWTAPDSRGANITYYLVNQMVNGTWKSVGNLTGTKL